MRYIPALLFLLLVLAVSFPGCTGASQETGILQTTTTPTPIPVNTTSIPSALKNVTPIQADELIRANKGNASFIILDVRTPSEYIGGRIQNAVNLDYNSTTFKEDASHLDKNMTYLVYCFSGGRSAAATQIMVELGFIDIYNMTGGITAWQSAGLPVVK
jgi:rhodanese-related sulfurtransferase